MDYEKEFENMQSAGGVFKPTVGVHKLEILEEPEETVYKDESVTPPKETPQVKIRVRTNNEDLVWYIGKGTTTKSVYGQLIALGKAKGHLKGENITLSVTSSTNRNGKDVNSYSILEAVEVLPQLEKPKEEKVE